MKLSNADFQLIRWNIFAVSAAAILSTLIVYGSQEYSDHAQKDFRSAQNQLSNARNRLNSAKQDQEFLAAFSRDYQGLVEGKIIGDEQRLDWMEGLDRLRQQNLVIDFSYSIAPQVLYTPQPAFASGNLNINYSKMKLQFHLLHEGQLLNFFKAMRSQIKGKYQLESCAMQRIANPGEDTAGSSPSFTTNIQAECSGGWITLKNPTIQP